ncbi:hypothetical protein KO465_08540 [Candidatus Micrarchaeota archaeon]|nr:hypothetical protein [Candidatus Micrarchaeota archaeon]
MEKKYKPIGKEQETFVHAIVEKHSEVIEKLNDPVVLGLMVAQLVEERENTNRILKNLMARLEKLENVIQKHGLEKEIVDEELILPEIDQNIVDFISQNGKVTAKDVKKEFNYKGTNAASARLNRLCNISLLTKKQAGRKVYFMLAKDGGATRKL